MEKKCLPFAYKQLAVFNHHIYEYTRGLRNLILHTTEVENCDLIREKLTTKGIPFVIQKINDRFANVFFGNQSCIDVLQRIGEKSLSDYSDEEDFILGTMLGYGMLQQCQRYIDKKNKKKDVPVLIG